MDNNTFKLTKIPLEYIVQILTLLYEEGYDYFDLEGTVDSEENDEKEKRDVIKISVRQEYFSEEDENGDDDDKINFDEDYEKLL
jgi:hypothetical protein